MWSAVLSLSGLLDGALTVSATETDVARNTGPAGTAAGTKDTRPPAYEPVTPERLLETRASAPGRPQLGYSGGKPTSSTVIKLDVTQVGATQVPADAEAVVLNVTGTQPDTGGHVTVWPCDKARPKTSNLNLVAGETRANLTVATVATSGADAERVCLQASTPMHLNADLPGWFPADE